MLSAVAPTGKSNCHFVGVALVSTYCCAQLFQALLTHAVVADPWGSILSLCVQWSVMGPGIAAGCWLALGDGSLWRRGIASLGGLIWVWIVWQGSVYLARDQASVSPGHTYYFVTGGVILAVTTTLWLAVVRALFGTQFRHRDSGSSSVGSRRQFTLRQLLLALTGIAVTIGAMRAVAPIEPNWRDMVNMWLDDFSGTIMWAVFRGLIVIPTAICIVYSIRRIPLLLVYLLVAVPLITLLERCKMGWSIAMLMGQFAFCLQQTMKDSSIFLPHVVALLLALRLMGYQISWVKRRDVIASDSG